MLEREIAAFVERTYAIYPANTATLPAVQQRAIYDRYAAAFTPPLPSGERQFPDAIGPFNPVAFVSP
jgi:acetyl esterase